MGRPEPIASDTTYTSIITLYVGAIKHQIENISNELYQNFGGQITY